MYMEERFGAWQVGTDTDHGQIEFKLFLPDRARDSTQYNETRANDLGENVTGFGDPQIVSIQVAGDFQSHLGQDNWDFASAPALLKEEHAKGWVWRYQTEEELPAGFYQYKYFVTFANGEQRKVGEPCTRYGGSENQNSAVVIGGSHSDVHRLSSPRKHLRDLVVYELMIDDFTDEFRGVRAPIDAVREKLDYLQHTLGINAVLFMPWTAWPGEGFSWGYTPYQYFSVEYRYANAINQPAEKLSWLKQLISELHDRDIHVIMDGVFNHVGDLSPADGIADGFPYRWLYQDPDACPYVGRFGGTFTGLKDLDFNQGCTQEFIRDVCFYWMDTFKIDGIRFDNTVNFYIPDEPRGLPMLLQSIHDHINAQGEEHFALVLEHLQADAAPVTNETGASSYWNNELWQRCFDYLWNGRIDARLLAGLDSHRGLQDDKVATLYLSNHDHSHVAWQAGARDNAGAMQWYRTQPYAIALLTSPGSVMLHNGQEFAEDYWLMEDDQGSNRRVKPRPLRWDFATDRIGAQLLGVYAKLIAIRKAHPGLRSNDIYPSGWETWQTQFNSAGYGLDAERQLVIYHRWGRTEDGTLERFIIALNFSAEEQYVDLPFSTDGTWHDLLNDLSVIVTQNRLSHHRIESYWGNLFFQQG
jgi:1,4-alpha-glucan branching enzyme